VAAIADIVLVGPSGYAAIVQEIHVTLGHIICDLVEQEYLRLDEQQGAYAAV
jgi:hypothetical protein